MENTHVGVPDEMDIFRPPVFVVEKSGPLGPGRTIPASSFCLRRTWLGAEVAGGKDVGCAQQIGHQHQSEEVPKMVRARRGGRRGVGEVAEGRQHAAINV